MRQQASHWCTILPTYSTAFTMSSFQISAFCLVAVLIFLAYQTAAQDRATYLTNGVQIPLPLERQVNAIPPSNFVVNPLIARMLQIQQQESLKPYEFGYNMNDGNGTTQHRQEIRTQDGNIRGNYGYVDPIGIYRKVEYYTDADGYHAKVESNEPGLSNKNSANTIFLVQNPPVGAIIPEQRLPLSLLHRGLEV
ncbi:adult-specific rigid cuticular protein 15.7-like [Stegodyphus dumicola]|uniref:adult-specific rigid cuticular protein 15.7-like n=1 Tax=Stegodyphus dumicola TaxID=202533 RepID=UPI0015A79390|nr:adult-specific rigid cuticular protein 15.7-like [Stegodyphus dumicola]